MFLFVVNTVSTLGILNAPYYFVFRFKQRTTEEAERVFWPVFSRKLKHKTAKKIRGNVNYTKLSLYARNQQFLSKIKKTLKKSLSIVLSQALQLLLLLL